MKKYLIIPLVLALFFTGCEQKTKNDGRGSSDGILDKTEILSKCLQEKDLASYVLHVHFEESSGTESEGERETNLYDGVLEKIKEPMVYHWKWEDKRGIGTKETEGYVLGDVRFYKDNNGEWTKKVLEEVGNNGQEPPTFEASVEFNPDSILESLGSYFEVTEKGDTYVASLESSSENIDEIRGILFEKSKDHSFFGELTSLKAQVVFEKDTGYPVSFESKGRFSKAEDAGTVEIRESGNYEKVNELEKIELPDELKNL